MILAAVTNEPPNFTGTVSKVVFLTYIAGIFEGGCFFLHVETQGSRLLISCDSAISWGSTRLLSSQWKREEKIERHLGNVIHGWGWQLPPETIPCYVAGPGCVCVCVFIFGSQMLSLPQ